MEAALGQQRGRDITDRRIGRHGPADLDAARGADRERAARAGGIGTQIDIRHTCRQAAERDAAGIADLQLLLVAQVFEPTATGHVQQRRPGDTHVAFEPKNAGIVIDPDADRAAIDLRRQVRRTVSIFVDPLAGHVQRRAVANHDAIIGKQRNLAAGDADIAVDRNRAETPDGGTSDLRNCQFGARRQIEVGALFLHERLVEEQVDRCHA